METAEIISHLAKNTKSSSAKINRKPLPNQNTILDRSQTKFKTGGIIVTATRRKPRDLNLNANTDTEDVEIAKNSQSKRYRHHQPKIPKENSSTRRMLATPSLN